MKTETVNSRIITVEQVTIRSVESFDAARTKPETLLGRLDPSTNFCDLHDDIFVAYITFITQVNYGASRCRIREGRCGTSGAAAANTRG